MRKRHQPTTLHHFSLNILTIIGMVLVWRGIWYLLDAIDLHLFGTFHGWTAFAGIVLGLLILYLPDKNLKRLF